MADPLLVEQIHDSAFVADGHADSLMWDRDLNVRSAKGHVDFPRLEAAKAKLQCFTLVTRGLPFIDGFGAFTWWNNFPKDVRRDEWTRALWQVEKLEKFCAASNGRVALARTREELRANRSAGRLSAVVGVEGGHVVGNDAGKVRALWDRGVRFMSLTHLDNNELGGSSFPLCGNRGLTTLGKEVLAEMAKVGMAVDLAHASPRALEDIFAGPNAPTMCSHTGIGSATKHWRNLNDDALLEIKRRGGVAGVIFATNFLGGRRLPYLVRHLARAVEVMSPEFVGLGSDYDGMIHIPSEMKDVSDLRLLTAALLDSGMPRGDVEQVLGNSYWRFFEATLP